MASSQRKIAKPWIAVNYVLLILFTLITLVPIVWMMYSSFKTMGDIMIDPLGLPKNPTMANYQKAFKYGHLDTAFFNSVFYSVISTTFTVLLALSAAFAITKFGYKSSKVFYAAFTLGLLITVNSVVTPLFMMERTVGLYNTRLGVILPYIAFSLPMSTLLAVSYVKGIPDSLIEAAVIDGANYIPIFWKIVVPMCIPVLATMSVLSFLGNWNEFLLVFTLTSGTNMRSLPVTINFFTGRLNSDYGLQFASLVIGTLPMLVFYIIAHKALLRGFGEGAIKE